MALTPEQISKYALKRVEGGSEEDGVVNVGGDYFQVQGFERQQQEGLDTDKGKTFGTSLQADAGELGKEYSSFNTINDIQGALNAVSGQSKAAEPTQLSQPAATALAGTKTYEDFRRSGLETDLIFGGAEGREKANQAYADNYRLNLQQYLEPGGGEGQFVGSGGLSGFDNDSQDGINKPASTAIAKKITGKQAGLKKI